MTVRVFAALSGDTLGTMVLDQGRLDIDTLGGDPFGAATTEITDYVVGFSIRRGRNSSLDRFEAGTCVLTLDNADRRFDPMNAAGPYAPNVLPMRRVRVQITHAGTDYDVFVGFAQSWAQSWEPRAIGGAGRAHAEVECVDAFGVLAVRGLSGVAAVEQGTGTRIGALLDAANWNDRDLDTGRGRVAAVTWDDTTTALDAIQDTADAEFGWVFVDRAGRVVFRDRDTATRPGPTIATFGDAAGDEFVYANAAAGRFDDAELWTHATLTGASGNPQSAGNAESQTKFGLRTFSKTTPNADDADVLQQAHWIVARRREPHMGFDEVVLDGTTTRFQRIIRDLGDRVTIVRRPPGGGAAMNVEGIVGAINHEFAPPNRFVTRWRIDDAPTEPIATLDASGDAGKLEGTVPAVLAL